MVFSIRRSRGTSFSRRHCQRERKRYRFRARGEQLEARRLLAAEIEPNDSIATATAFTAGEALEGRLSRSDDADFFSTTLLQGQRFSINTGNINAPRFSPTLPPGIEIFDADGSLLTTSFDGRDISVVAPSAGRYFVGIGADNAFGTFVGEYGMQSSVSGAPTDSETEPNNTPTSANAAPLGRPFTGTIESPSDIDRFRVSVEVGDALVIAFAGLPENSPAVRFLSSTGEVFGESRTGNGLAVTMNADRDVFVEISGNNISGPPLAEYVAVINRFSNATTVNENGSRFEDAVAFTLDGRNQTLAGELTGIDDVDVFRFEIDAIKFLNFDLQLSGQERIVDSGTELRLFNSRGQFLERSDTGFLNTDRTDALVPGTYFLEVSSHSPVGVGAYALTATTRTDFSLQRDNAVHFMDFDSADPYQGFDRVAAYAAPGGIPFYTSMFESRYEPFDVDVTLQQPIDGNERVASGIGDFGDIGAGGFGGGGRGVRSSNGNTVNNATETELDSIAYYGTSIVNHEFGHAVGMPHARDIESVMSYVGTTDYLPVGSTFAFQGTDNRRPGLSVFDQRDYLDWSLQSGAQVFVAEAGPNAAATSLNPFFREMTLDHEPVQNVAAAGQPFDAAAGDFNNDGTPDVAIANEATDTVEIFLTTPGGTFGAPISIDVGGNLARWTEALAVDDFDGDGDDDLAVAVYSANRVTVYLNNGNATFRPGVDYPMPREPQGLAVTDVNNDDVPDLIAVTVVANQAVVLVGNGDGTFNNVGSSGTGDNPHSVAAGDFDADGNIDLATANANAGTATVLMGNGNGAFSFGSTLPVGNRPQGLTVADFNRDGAADIAVANRDDRTIDVFLSLGDGSFTRPVTYPIQIAPQDVTPFDVDGDGQVDLVSGGFDNSLQVLLGFGDGSFSRGISLEAGNRESTAAVADFDGDGEMELAVTTLGDRLVLLDEPADNPRNDRVTVYGSIDGKTDVDRFTMNVLSGQRVAFDIDAAEFQYPLDAVITVSDSTGAVLATSDDALDRNSGIESVDPYLETLFIFSDVITIEVAGKHASAGEYRLKVTPHRAWDTDAPRIFATIPDNGATVNGTSQLVFFFNDQIDPATLNAINFVVTGATTGVHFGSGVFNPLDSTYVWNAFAPLPIDTYTVTINGDPGGVTDLAGNLLDGEIATDFSFPDISGDGTPGGTFTTSFAINSLDTTPAQVNNVSYLRDPYNRGRFQLNMSDQLSITSARTAAITLRGAGFDNQFDTADDTTAPLDAVYDTLRHINASILYLYTRGVPDSGLYRIEGSLVDAAGLPVAISEVIGVSGSVAESALYSDPTLTQQGLTGSYVNASLRGYAPQDDWRVSQTISGVRTDPQVAFTEANFGTRADVGITGGTDDLNWDDFSVQWDGFVAIPEDGVRLVTRSDDGSRFWVDVNGDGVFSPTGDEFFDNGWGTGHRLLSGEVSVPLDAGVYQIRVQYEDGGGGNEMHLDWIRPGQPVDADGLIHGPSITDVSVATGRQVVDDSPTELTVTFSGALDPTTITNANLFLRYSQNPSFFDGNDVIMNDSSGRIQWDPTTFQATLGFDEPLPNGYFLLEANGDAGGLANPAGNLLDGEFLSSTVIGNQQPFIYQHTPSGDGIPGGDYQSPFSVALPELEILLAATAINENGGETVATITRLFADLGVALDVTLRISDDTELTAPLSVTIPAGQESVLVNLTAIDDDLLDGNQTVTITADADGLLDDQAEIIVTDYEFIRLAISDREISEFGGVTQLTLSRLDPVGSLTVSILNDEPDELSVAGRVTFPNGVAEVTVPLTAVDDSFVDGTQTVTLTVTHPDLIDSETLIDVTDYEQLVIEIIDDSISELDGVAMATVRRTDLRGSLAVVLSEAPSGLVSVPGLIQIAAGQFTSSPFPIRAIDNDQLDAVRTATVTATAQGYVPGSDTIDLTDHEQLILSIAATSISELDGATTATVNRTDADDELTVILQSSDPNRVNVPASITLPAGVFTSEPFSVTAIDNTVVDGAAQIDITASATSYFEGAGSVTVTDFEPLQLTLDPDQVFENDGTVTYTLRRPAAGASVVVDLSGGLPGVASIPAQVTFATGAESLQFEATISDDEVVGENRSFTISTVTDAYIDTSLTTTVIENDLPELELTFATDTLNEDNGSVTGRLTRNTTGALAIQLSASVPDQLVLPESVRFDQGRRFVDFRISTIDNVVVDGDRVVTIRAAGSSHPAATAAVTIIDDDHAGYRLLGDDGSLHVGEAGITDSYQVVLTSAPLTDVQFNLESSDTAQVTVIPSVLTFNSDNWNEPQTVSLEPVDDVTVEDAQSITVATAIISATSDPAFATLPGQTVNVQVIDDDVAGIALSQTNGSTIVSELGIEDEFSLRLESRPLSPVTLVVDGAQVPEAIFTPSSVTFTPDNWDVDQTIVVSTPLDFDADQNSIGSVYIRVDESTTAFGFKDLRERTIAVVVIDSTLNDLRVRSEDNAILLVDEFTGLVLQRTPIPADPTGRVLVTLGNPSERVLVEATQGTAVVILQSLGGDDVIELATLEIAEIDGGDGNDSVRPTGPVKVFDLTDPSTVPLSNVETIDLSADGSQELILNVGAVRSVTGVENQLLVQSGDDDSLEIGPGWTLDAPRISDGVPIHQLLQEDVVLRIANGRMWQNPILSADVDRNGMVTSLDALTVVNRLGLQDTTQLPTTYEGVAPFYYDVNNDHAATALDALLVINFLARINNAPSEAELNRVAGLPQTEKAASGVESETRFDSVFQSVGSESAKPTWSSATVDDALLELTIEDAEPDDPEGSISDAPSQLADGIETLS